VFSCRFIGNPPSDIPRKPLREYFSIGNGQKIQRPTYPKEWQDLIDFEGNANGFQYLPQVQG
jgi:dGTPase